MAGLHLGAPLAQTGRVMGMRNPQGPPIDPPGSLMYIYVALACLLVLARSPAIPVTAFSSRSRRLVRRRCLPIPQRPHARPSALDDHWIPQPAREHSSPSAVSGCSAIQASDRVWFSDCVCKCDCARHPVLWISQPCPGDFLSIMAVIGCGEFRT